MEAPPSRSQVHSYKFIIAFCCPLTPTSSSEYCPLVSTGLRTALETGGELNVDYNDVSHLETIGAKIARACLVIGLVGIAAAWLPHAKHEIRRIRQQRPCSSGEDDHAVYRLALLLASLAFFIDPIDCGVQFARRGANIPPFVAFLSFASRRLGEAGFLLALLLAANGDGESAHRITVKWNKQRQSYVAPQQASMEARPASPTFFTIATRDGAHNARQRSSSDSDDSLEADDHRFGNLLQPLTHTRRKGTRLSMSRTVIRKLKERWWLVIPVLYLFFGVASLGLRFPSLWGANYAPTLALSNWPTSALRAFVAYSLGMVLTGFAWFVAFCHLLWRAGRRLNRAPYLATRRHQLSYRFFVLQAILVAAVAFVAYAILMVQLARRYGASITILTTPNKSGKTHALEDLAGALEALVADDVRDLATAFFFEVYVGLLLYLNLPPPPSVESQVLNVPFNHGGDAAVAYVRRFLPQAARAVVQRAGRQVTELADLGATLVGARFVMTERADRSRRRDWRKRRKRIAQNSKSSDAHDPLEDPPDYFVVNTARWLVRVAAEAYFDVAPSECQANGLTSTEQTVSGLESQQHAADSSRRDLLDRTSEGTPKQIMSESENTRKLTGGSAGLGNVERLGLTPVCELHVEEDDTYAVVATHASRPWLVIAFRGSASLKHWVTNINIRQHRLSLHEDKPDLIDSQGIDSLEAETDTEIETKFREDARVDQQTLENSNVESDDDDDPMTSDSVQPIERSRAFVDALVRCCALVFRGVERGLSLMTATAEAAGRATGAADYIPGVERLILPCVHRGFWVAYRGVRSRLHRVVRDVCLAHNIERILITGHSLGGALATLAAADLAAHTIPWIGGVRCGSRRIPRLTHISFGSPRVGNRVWARIYDTLVPDSWRVVADGDVVTGVPRLFFKHCGTPVVVDGERGGAGFLIVDPSFIEKRLQLRLTRKLSSHALEAYVRGLWGAAGILNPSPAELSLFADSVRERPEQDAASRGNIFERARVALRQVARRSCATADSQGNTLSEPLIPGPEVHSN